MNSTTTGGSTASSPRSRPRIAAFAALSALFVAAALWRPPDDGLPLCALKLATGVSCPGCGMTRALAAIGRGEPALALKYHVFAPIVALAAVFTWAAIGIGLATGRNFLPDLNGRRVSIACVVFIAAFLAYWLFRLWRGTAP
jgi:hypothetical protein